MTLALRPPPGNILGKRRRQMRRREEIALSLRTFGGPGRYIQGPGALPAAARMLAGWTRRAAVVADPVAREAAGQALMASADAEAVELDFQDFGGECTAAEIDRQIALAREAGAGAVLAMGGGKAIDTGKGVGGRAGPAARRAAHRRQQRRPHQLSHRRL